MLNKHLLKSLCFINVLWCVAFFPDLPFIWSLLTQKESSCYGSWINPSKWLIFDFILKTQCMTIPPIPVVFLGLYTRINQDLACLTHIHVPKEMRVMFPGPPFKTQNAPPTWDLDLNSDWLIDDVKQELPGDRSLPYKLRATVPHLLDVPQRSAFSSGI